MSTQVISDALVEEYETYVTESCIAGNTDLIDPSRLEKAMCNWGDWTSEGAKAVISLAKQHGAFILRNAAALATAMGIEDGECGL